MDIRDAAAAQTEGADSPGTEKGPATTRAPPGGALSLDVNLQ